jgi:hypothetical protein
MKVGSTRFGQEESGCALPDSTWNRAQQGKSFLWGYVLFLAELCNGEQAVDSDNPERAGSTLADNGMLKVLRPGSVRPTAYRPSV